MLYIRQGDITRFTGDAIVNAASTRLHRGGGVCGAIHRAAGPQLLAACKSHIRRHGRLPVGTAVLTPPGKLPCRSVIHATGPHWLFGLYAERQDALLAQAYLRSLTLARENGFRSIAFPCISTGHYFYPHKRAADTALRTIVSFLTDTAPDMDVHCFCFSRRDFLIYRRIQDNKIHGEYPKI
ncbi:TPA: macro domain-containing protein [Salmonella enterica]|uniref:O-acetyl-ADP-ribose deacetylase n=1 Tax=Salmonella enterica TaxID=28901 RepID=A0A754EBK2_SALER|nr:macro domain-containing protein [Salmonella enterica]ECU9164061.1 O-acetyl-ADP-ribose deacetylase [Salmonella enterica subsp. enterica serovar Newport str. CFSAN000599]EDU1196923.1 O-acetyl-ADP-ribose deacetylase [Salmonella enterica subsp. enterica serovar Heidelberg str. CFSAN000576]EAO8183441.1 O-acetyl-ADP-ribose deacetylase [Salmonella enterica]MDJ6542231.1 macro domain-containing protein [Salmonella enterica]MDJ7049022.1 macro domain-containing protein [Salmonella enterica]